MTKRGGEVKQERKRAKRVNTDADADLLEVISYLNQHQYFS
jgi:AdoMet-dependent rRNA methyltransferase SPB1